MTQEEMLQLKAMMEEVVDSRLDVKLEPINKRLDNIELRQTKFELIMENETNRAIKVIAEGHSIINRKLDEDLGLENRVVSLENKVSAIEYSLNRTT